MINIALIGAGGVSRSHRAAWLKIENAKVLGVADLYAEQARGAATELGAERWTTDYTELLRWDEIDAVDICATENAHGQIATDAAEHGKHILVEKPIATTLEDADRMIEAAAKNDVLLMVGHTHRFRDVGRTARATIDSGEIGAPVYMRYCSGGGFWKQDWSGNRISPIETGGNVVTNGVHGADIINWYMGSRPISVYAQAHNVTSSYLEMYDWFMFTIKYENGAIAVLEMSRANMPRSNSFRSITVIGTEGELNTGTQHDTQWAYGDDGVSFLGVDGQHGFDREISEFVDSVENKRQPLVTGEMGRMALEMCLAAERSIKTGEVVNLGGQG